MVFKISTLTLPIPRTKEDLLVIHGCPLKKFTLRELKSATNNFGSNNILGRGGFGTVYRGTLADASLVAIKRCINMDSPGAELQFQAEMEMGGSPASNHRNVLRLRGYCITRKERLLVYPFMVNRSVHSRLQDRRPESEPALDWPTRKRIALGAAKGLAHFHNGPSFTVIHRDIKAANILLDDEFEAVICDFGLVKFVGRNGIESIESNSVPTEGRYEEEDLSEDEAEEEDSDDDNYTKSCWNFSRTTMRLKEEGDKESRMCTKWSRWLFTKNDVISGHYPPESRGGAGVVQAAYHDSYTQVTTAARGTVGHVAPEYLIFGKCSVKSDVFGYGVMLLELVTGQRAYDLARLANDDDATLLDWVKQLLHHHELDLVVDSDLQGDDIQGEIEQMIQLALLCTEEDPEKRPVMTEVIKIIENFGKRPRADHDSPVQRFSLPQLKVATHDFSNKNIMGRSGSNTVYRGRLQEDGSAVVVKRMGDKSKRGRMQFRAEVKLGGIISGRHPNLLQLRGYCNSGKERLLVYPFMANRSLEWRLRPERSLPLDWQARKQIALGVAKGIAYLHYNLESNTITHIHRLVKPSNILLDSDFNPSLSNLRLRSRKSRHVHGDEVSTEVSSVHSDVYGFGMTLLVIVGGNEVTDLLAWAASNQDNHDRNAELGLHDCLKILGRHGKNLSVDPRLMDGDSNFDSLMDRKDEVEQLMKVALLCTQPFALDRPEMSEVIKMLEAISRGGLNVCAAFDRGNLFRYGSTPTEPPQLPHEFELGDTHSPPLDTDGSDQENHQTVPESVPQLEAANSTHLLNIPKQGGMFICDHVEEPAMQDRWKVFLYEVVSDALTTKSKLFRSGMSLDPLCPLCNEYEEDNLHLFFNCAFSNRVWESAVGMRMDILGFESVREAVDAILMPKAAKIRIPWDGEATLFSHQGVAVMYSIWTHRNEVCFDKVSPDVVEVVSLSRKYFPEHLG